MILVCWLAGFSGHANYCAANAALDAMGEASSVQGLPHVSVQWGAWSSVGECAMLCHSFQFVGNSMLAMTYKKSGSRGLLFQGGSAEHLRALDLSIS